MPATCLFECGCMVTREMFGKREVTDVQYCERHRINLEKQAADLFEAIKSETISEEQ